MQPSYLHGVGVAGVEEHGPACVVEGILSFVTAIYFPIEILHTNENGGGRMTEDPRLSGPDEEDAGEQVRDHGDCPGPGRTPFSMAKRGLVTFYSSKLWTKTAAAGESFIWPGTAGLILYYK